MDAVSFGDVIQVQMKGHKGFVKFEDESQAELKLTTGAMRGVPTGAMRGVEEDEPPPLKEGG